MLKLRKNILPSSITLNGQKSFHTIFRRVTVIACLLLVGGMGASTLQAAAHSSARAKKGAVHHRRAIHRRRISAAPIVVIPVIDTTCLDTAGMTQKSLTEEINRWSSVRYKHGGTSLRGVDCSGFTSKVFERALAINLPRTSHEQALTGANIDRDSLEFGDLVFFYSKKKSRHKRINHVGIYIGDGNFVHSHRHGGVGIDSLSESYYENHFAWAKRVITPSDEISEPDESQSAE